MQYHNILIGPVGQLLSLKKKRNSKPMLLLYTTQEFSKFSLNGYDSFHILHLLTVLTPTQDSDCWRCGFHFFTDCQKWMGDNQDHQFQLHCIAHCQCTTTQVHVMSRQDSEFTTMIKSNNDKKHTTQRQENFFLRMQSLFFFFFFLLLPIENDCY